MIEYKCIELDYCTECHGVWFDAGELGLLLKSLGVESQKLPVESLLDTPEPDHKEKHHRCPICWQKMRKVALGEDLPTIDACRRGDGLWFDGGELARLLGELATVPASPSPQQQITDFLRDVFQCTQSAPRTT
ncbi:MAG: zf-TFIIB domain-containing protein [Candidatus Bathyarchaeota archaeon]|nr:zf-TFIIB domain-containing protein [Candidatus Bathyarchaeota archaeon]